MTIKPGLDLAAFSREHRVRFVRKDDSWLMRFLSRLLGLFGYKRFMTPAWTTIGRTVYYPTTGPGSVDWPGDTFGIQSESWPGLLHVMGVTNSAWIEYAEKHRNIIEHELYHVLQFERLWHLHSLLYLVFPLPFGLAWYRWRCEREAYLHELRHYPPMYVCVDNVVGEAVWSPVRTGLVDDEPVDAVVSRPPDRQDDESDGFQVGDVYVNASAPHVDHVVATLWRVYGWCWPRAWMRKWFVKRLKDEQ